MLSPFSDFGGESVGEGDGGINSGVGGDFDSLFSPLIILVTSSKSPLLPAYVIIKAIIYWISFWEIDIVSILVSQSLSLIVWFTPFTINWSESG